MQKEISTKKLMFFISCLFLFLIASDNIYSQENDENISQYLDDAGIQESKNILKVDFMAILSGDFQLVLEHRFKKIASIEVGLGHVSNRGIRGKYTEFLTGIPSHNLAHGRLSYSIAIKLYTNKAPEGLFYSLNYRKRPYLGADVTDFYMSSGYQYILKKRTILAIGIGIGIRKITSTTNPTIGNSINGHFPLQFSLGYIL